VETASGLHTLSPQSKIVAVVGFVIVVVATPREWVLAFAGYATLLAIAFVWARIPPRRIATGLAIEVPFVLFALLLPFVGPAPDGWLGLSTAGLWAAWNIVVKASLGVLAATLLASTTLPADLVAGLQALRLPAALVAILTFFVRYVDVVADQFQRMRTAQKARGLSARSPSAWPVLANGLGALFVRSFERGERVHLALVSRGYDGRLPAPTGHGPSWPAALLTVAALLVCAAVGLT
jgi:cobalt/nickel transport system permease protein